MKINSNLAALAVLTTLALAPTAHAQTTVYTNIAPYVAKGFNANKNATATNFATSALVTDIEFAPGSAGDTITNVRALTGNVGVPGTFMVTVKMGFWAADGASGGPGTLLKAFSPGTISEQGNAQITAAGGTLTTDQQFTIPANEKIYAGIYYDNSDAPSLTLAQLNTMVQAWSGAPTIGKTQSTGFRSNIDFNTGFTSNPTNDGNAGITAPNGYAWAFQAKPPTAATPAPSSALVLLGGAVPLVGVLRKRRK